MKVKALISFSGIVTMHEGEIKDIENKEVLTDLLKARYVKKVTAKDEKKDIESNETQHEDEIMDIENKEVLDEKKDVESNETE